MRTLGLIIAVVVSLLFAFRNVSYSTDAQSLDNALSLYKEAANKDLPKARRVNALKTICLLCIKTESNECAILLEDLVQSNSDFIEAIDKEYAQLLNASISNDDNSASNARHYLKSLINMKSVPEKTLKALSDAANKENPYISAIACVILQNHEQLTPAQSSWHVKLFSSSDRFHVLNALDSCLYLNKLDAGREQIIAKFMSSSDKCFKVKAIQVMLRHDTTEESKSKHVNELSETLFGSACYMQYTPKAVISSLNTSRQLALEILFSRPSLTAHALSRIMDVDYKSNLDEAILLYKILDKNKSSRTLDMQIKAHTKNISLYYKDDIDFNRLVENK